MVARVMVVIAMADEAAPIVAHLNLTPDAAMPAPFKAYAGTHGSMAVTVVCNGACPRYGVDAVGTEAAALAGDQDDGEGDTGQRKNKRKNKLKNENDVLFRIFTPTRARACLSLTLIRSH